MNCPSLCLKISIPRCSNQSIVFDVLPWSASQQVHSLLLGIVSAVDRPTHTLRLGCLWSYVHPSYHCAWTWKKQTKMTFKWCKQCIRYRPEYTVLIGVNGYMGKIEINILYPRCKIPFIKPLIFFVDFSMATSQPKFLPTEVEKYMESHQCKTKKDSYCL